MNERIKKLAKDAGLNFGTNISGVELVYGTFEGSNISHIDSEELGKFAELLLRNLAEELLDVAKGSKKVNPEWANGVEHAAMLAQRMTMNLPQWPESE